VKGSPWYVGWRTQKEGRESVGARFYFQVNPRLDASVKSVSQKKERDDRKRSTKGRVWPSIWVGVKRKLLGLCRMYEEAKGG